MGNSEELKPILIAIFAIGIVSLFLFAWTIDNKDKVLSWFSKNKKQTRNDVIFWRMRILIALATIGIAWKNYYKLEGFWEKIVPLTVPLFGDDVPISEFHVIYSPILVFVILPYLRTSVLWFWGWITAKDITKIK